MNVPLHLSLIFLIQCMSFFIPGMLQLYNSLSWELVAKSVTVINHYYNCWESWKNITPFVVSDPSSVPDTSSCSWIFFTDNRRRARRGWSIGWQLLTKNTKALDMILELWTKTYLLKWVQCALGHANCPSLHWPISHAFSCSWEKFRTCMQPISN